MSTTPTIPMGQAGFSGPVAFNYYPLLSDGDDVVSKPASVASGGGVIKRGSIVKWDPSYGPRHPTHSRVRLQRHHGHGR